MTPADIERAAQALSEHRDAGGIPWADKMELSRENWREEIGRASCRERVSDYV